MKYMIAIIGALSATGAAAQDTVRKDVLLVDRIEKAAHIEVPHHGLTMDQVNQGFGEPVNRIDSIGEPPITRWVYAGFTVYFENQWVIHAVVNRASETETLPESA